MSKHDCPECGQDIPNDIWKDPSVKEALKSGRSADDIMVLRCPKCDRLGYYNQGSSFSCRFCNESWYCRSDDENAPTRDNFLFLDDCDVLTLADTVTETTEGYDNLTI